MRKCAETLDPVWRFDLRMQFQPPSRVQMQCAIPPGKGPGSQPAAVILMLGMEEGMWGDIDAQVSLK